MNIHGGTIEVGQGVLVVVKQSKAMLTLAGGEFLKAGEITSEVKMLPSGKTLEVANSRLIDPLVMAGEFPFEVELVDS